MEILNMRVQAKDGTEGTVVSLHHNNTMVRVIWDEWQEWCYPEWDEPTTYEFISEFYSKVQRPRLIQQLDTR